ncbi:MAG: cupin domain-containing protein [Deltaproteobacteria bacterium]|nr:cupin domain-containing protein [Deltaproteobacteria bacterium]
MKSENSSPHTPSSPQLLSSHFINPENLSWQPTKYPGVDIKVLYQDEPRGLMTALFRWAPGSSLPFHEHVDIEQTYVIQGHLVDDEGECRTGEFVWRPGGSRHVAHAPEGALILAFFLQPNRFFRESGGTPPQ